MVRRSLIVLGMATAVMVLGFVALFAAGGGGNPSPTATLQTLPTTTTTTAPGPTTTTISTLKGPGGTDKRLVVDFVAVPNVVGMTLIQADPALAAVGLSSEISSPTTEPSGTSSTGTIVAQAPAPGSQVTPGTVVQLTVSGY